MTDFAQLNSPVAVVCHKQHRADCGVGTAWFVMLADGYLIDCGAESYSEARAHTLAEMVNCYGAVALSRDVLKAWRPA